MTFMGIIKYTSMSESIRKNLFDYLNHLNKDNDFSAIKRYLQSPFFKVKSREKVIKLFEILILHHPEYKDNSHVNIASLNRKLKITYVANLKTILVDCIEDYLRIKRVNENEHLKVLSLAESLEDMNMYEQHEKYVDSQLKQQLKKNTLTEKDYYLKYKLLRGKFRSSLTKEKVNHNALEEAINVLNYYYLYSNIINLTALQTIAKIVKKETDVSQAIDVVNSIKNIDNIADPNIVISFLIFKIINLEDIGLKREAYLKLKKMTIQNWEKLTEFYRYEVYLNMINFVNEIVSCKIGNLKDELYKVHKFWINNNTYKNYENIDKTLFYSIIKAFCNAGKVKPASDFIEAHKNMLVKPEREHTLALCKANINFVSEKHRDSIRLLMSLNKLDPIFELYARMLELKCWFELKNTDQFNFTYKRIYNFIDRQKNLSDEIKLKYKISIQWIRKIEKARYKNQLEKLIDFYKKLSEQFYLKDRVWITKKLEDLIF